MGKPPGMNPGPSRRPRAVPALLVKEHEVPLAEGETLIGRGGDARISILGSLVSRRHARLVCSDGRVTIEDLASRNGVFVNGARLAAPALLEDGDTVLIGTTQLTFFLGTPDEGESRPSKCVFDEQGNMVPESEVIEDFGRRTALRFESEDTVDFDREDVTVQGTRPPKPRLASALLQKPPTETEPPPTPRAKEPVVPSSGPLPKLQPIGRMSSSGPPAGPPSRPRASAPPRVGPALRPTPAPASVPPRAPLSGQDPLLAALGVIDRMLARGDADAASRALLGHLGKRLDGARNGAALGAEVLDAAAFRCLSLLELTGDPSWFDAVLELHSVARAPMAHAVIDRLTPFVGVVPAQSLGLLGGYQRVLRDLLGEVDVDALEACERVLALGG